MSSAIRLYERLDQIPQDPSDPESLDDLIVCAFGAFERYYVCWRNKAGEYRQDGYDLPPALQEWLWPPDNTTRDFASLQVVFGRGDEYFASDKDGKLEYKEPEKKPSDMTTTTTTTTPEEKPTLRRTRTMSAFRGVSPETTKPLPPAPYDPVSPSRRSSQSASRPPSMSFSLSDASSTRSPSISSMFSTLDPMPTIASRPPSEYHHHVDASSSPLDSSSSSSSSKPITTAEDSTHIVTTATALRLKRRSRPLSISFKPSLTHARLSQTKPTPSSAADTHSAPTPTPQPSHQPPATTTTTTTTSSTTASAHCTCHLHPPPRPPQLSISIASAIATSPRQPTSFSSSPSFTPRNTAYFEDDEYVAPLPVVNPFPMGSMMAFFSKPGYQLGDGLRRYDEDDEGGGFGVVEEYEGEGYEGEEGFYEDQWAAWEAANGRV